MEEGEGMKARGKREKWLTAAYLAVFFLLALTLAAFQPLRDPEGLTSPPDESDRYAVPRFIYEHGALPTGLEEELRIPGYGSSYGLYNVFPYIVMGGIMRLAGLFTRNPGALLLSARLVNVVSGLLMAWVVRKLSRLLFAKPSWQWLFCLLIVYQPMNIFVHSYVNTDSFCMLSTAMMVYALVRLRRDGMSVPSCLWLAGGMSLCVLSYYNGYGYILCGAILFISYFAGEKRFDWKGMWRWGLLTAGVVILLSGWWFVRAYIVLDGDILGFRTQNELALRYGAYAVSPMNTYQARGVGIAGMLRDMLARRFFFKVAGTLIAAYGSLTLRSYLVYGVYFLIWGAGFAGCVAAFLRVLKARRGWRYWFFHLTLLFCVLIPFILYLRYCYAYDYQEQGRYLLPSLVPAMYYVASGLRELSERLSRRAPQPARALPAVCGILIVCCALWQVYAVALPAYLAG